MTAFALSDHTITQFSADGVIVLRGLFTNHMQLIAEAIDQNMASPGPYAAENLLPGEQGRFFDDYCNWQRIPALREVIYRSEAGRVAAAARGVREGLGHERRPQAPGLGERPDHVLEEDDAVRRR